MKELSLNILDIAQNSIRAGASLIKITLAEDNDTLKITIEDNGCGMSEEMVRSVTDPFCTTRKTRKVGLGIPFFKEEAEQTGGRFLITSKSEREYLDSHGTIAEAEFNKNHIDFTPLGDIVSTVCTLVQGLGNIDLCFSHKNTHGEISLDTRELREILGTEIPLSEPEVLDFIKGYLNDKYMKITNESEENT